MAILALRILALGAPAYLALTIILLFSLAVLVTYTFSLVRHAKSLAKDAKRAGERLDEASREVKTQVQTMSEHTDELGGRTRPSGRRGRV